MRCHVHGKLLVAADKRGLRYSADGRLCGLRAAKVSVLDRPHTACIMDRASSGCSPAEVSRAAAWSWPKFASMIRVVQLVALGTVLAVVRWPCAVYVIEKRPRRSVQDEQQEPTASELMSKFRELHSRGELSDAEFRTIKTTLAARLQEELKDNGETG